MRSHSLSKLEYNRIIEILLTYTCTYLGKRHVEGLSPICDRSVISRKLAETGEACRLLAKGGSAPLPSLEGIEVIMTLIGTGYILTENDFGCLAQFIRSCEQLRQYMAAKQSEAPEVAAYAASMFDLKPLRESIETCIDRGRILDTASTDLHKIRKKIRISEEKLQKRLEGLLSRYSDSLQERLISKRSGRYVLSVKKEYRKRIPGTVLDESASGQTVFIEPSELGVLQMDLSAWRAEESREETQILARLSGQIETYTYELTVNLDTVGHYDFLFAKAKWGLAIGGIEPALSDNGVIDLRGAWHPLLTVKPVPLNIRMGDEYKALLITGPNTGGKTVALKTVGLLTLMAQSGLLIPAAEGSRLAVFQTVEVDIGDDQSLHSSLSTFSSHLQNVIDILAHAGPSSLVLLDELATGTDPGEGVGLSIAVLEELYRRGALMMATTHFNEIKEYARVSPGFQNARMAFDEETLRPLYRLDLGEAGNSYAFVIASKLGLEEKIIERARTIACHLKSGEGTPSLPIAQHIKEKVIHPPSRKQENRHKLNKNSDETSPVVDWTVGDVVFIPQLRKLGVVFRLPDERGMMIVQVQKEKLSFNQKRVRKYIEKKLLYPSEDYDMDIVFDSVENRKKRKQMSKRHIEGLLIENSSDQNQS